MCCGGQVETCACGDGGRVEKKGLAWPDVTGVSRDLRLARLLVLGSRMKGIC